MYASAWIFVSAPIVVSFSTSEPRPITTSSPTTTRSRTHDWSPRMTRAPTFVPAKTIAPVETIVPSPITVGSSGSRFAVERAESEGCFPTTACSSTFTPSPSTVPGWTIAVGWISATQALREELERAHDLEPVVHLAPVPALLHEPDEVLALELERLVVRHLGTEDVARARPPLAVRVRRLLRRLVVDGDLAVELHVVEHGHLVAADDGEPPHLVRVEPREVHVRDLSRGEAKVAEDDVLDPLVEERVAVRRRLDDLLLDQVEDDREVVDAERPERVLVLADLPEVLAVAVDDEHVAELARVDELLQLLHRGVVEEQVARHQHEAARLRQGDQLLHLGDPHRRRLLDEDVQTGRESLSRERIVGRDRRRDHDRIDLAGGDHLVEVAGDPSVGEAARELVPQRVARVAEPAEVGDVVVYAREVPAPVAEPDLADAELSVGAHFPL